MISVFSSKHMTSFIIAKSFLEKEGIPFIPKGENAEGLEYKSFEILVKEEDYEKSKNLISAINEKNPSIAEKHKIKHNPILGVLVITVILVSVILLFVFGLWIRGEDY